MDKFKLVWNAFLAFLICILTVITCYFANNGLHKPVPREIIHQKTVAEEGELLKAQTDFTGMAKPVVFEDGSLVIPNNTTVDEVITQTIITETCKFQIPSAWLENVVIRTIKVDQITDPELYDVPIYNTEVVQFYEKKTFDKYHSTDHIYDEDAERYGKITELYITDAKKNDMEQQDGNPQKLKAATIKTDDRVEYGVYLYQLKTADGTADKEYETEYAYLSDVDYKGCILSSLEPYDGTLTVANAYVKSMYIDNYQEGETSNKIPADYPIRLKNQQEKVKHNGDVPENVSKLVGATTLYQWSEGFTLWQYNDRESSYPYSAMESGGTPIETTPTPTPDIDIGVNPETETNAEIGSNEDNLIEEPAEDSEDVDEDEYENNDEDDAELIDITDEEEW